MDDWIDFGMSLGLAEEIGREQAEHSEYLNELSVESEDRENDLDSDLYLTKTVSHIPKKGSLEWAENELERILSECTH